MCGITGYFKYNLKSDDLPLDFMVEQLNHRGPDGRGTFLNDNIGLGHARLSIQDLSIFGHQPMKTDDSNFIISYNGEIYNHQEIRVELISNGYKFKGTSDTETILNGYSYFGDKIFELLNGVFSIAIYDSKKDEITLARDRFGVKPLYYASNDNYIVFGSEIKSILRANVFPKILNKNAIPEFLYYGYNLDEKTMFQGIKKLMPGNILKINKNGFEIRKFWSFEENINENFEISEKEIIYKTKDLLENAVKKQLISDVPVGVFLSGGIDSSAVTAFASRHYEKKLDTFSAGFDFNGGQNELPLARKVAKLFGTDHHEFFIKGNEIEETVVKLITHHDEPFSDAANIPLFLMAKEVKNKCKVILQGDGGDEIFGGYSRYHVLNKYKFYKNIGVLGEFINPLNPSITLKNRIKRFNSIFNTDSESKMYALLLTVETETDSPLNVFKSIFKTNLNTDPFKQYQILTDKFQNLSTKSQKMLWIDTQFILPNQFLEKVDKSTMANGVEVRVPFLDNELTEFIMNVPTSIKLKGGVNKYLLKKALKNIIPDEVLFGKKLGFGVPYSNWLNGPLSKMLNHYLFSDYIKSLNIFDFNYINQLIIEHKNNKKDNGFILWKLLNFCIWLETYNINLLA